MSSPVKVDDELLENLEFLISMELLEKEADWDALGVEGAVDASDADLEESEGADEQTVRPTDGEES